MAVAHEMRGPLAPIANAVKALELHGDDPACVAAARSVIHRQVTQLARLVEDLLDVGRFRLASPELHTARVDLRNVVHAAIEVAQPTIAARGHELMVCASSGEVIVQGDEGRLTQVIVNLLVNAAKFTERGGQIRVLLESSAGDHRVHIRDTGIGISHDMLSHIFDPFVQAAHRAGSAGGVGLGLALAQQLTRLHGGSLSAHSDGPGKGSEFVLRLPAS
jgi:signal transduction histidine kinase